MVSLLMFLLYQVDDVDYVVSNVALSINLKIRKNTPTF